MNQPEFLARACGLPFVVTGENYNVGVPFFRVAGGNAILSRFRLTPVANFDLAGRKPFWVTSNNRRALAASAELGGEPVLLVALHNDSFDMRNNTVQMRQVLDFVGDRPVIVAGDFNNRPNDRSIQMIHASGKFAGAFDGPPTFFEGDRKERIDYIFVPAGWELVDHRVARAVSGDDHAAVDEGVEPAARLQGVEAASACPDDGGIECEAHNDELQHAADEPRPGQKRLTGRLEEPHCLCVRRTRQIGDLYQGGRSRSLMMASEPGQ